MGYCMDLRDYDFVIKKENFGKALLAIKALANKTDEMSGGVFSRTGRDKCFAWVNTLEFLDAETLAEALKAWRWDVECDKEGNIDGIMFMGEKSGDDLVLFSAIAPFVEENSFIEMEGEDGCIWRWVFSNGECEEKYGNIVFE